MKLSKFFYMRTTFHAHLRVGCAVVDAKRGHCFDWSDAIWNSEIRAVKTTPIVSWRITASVCRFIHNVTVEI